MRFFSIVSNIETRFPRKSIGKAIPLLRRSSVLESLAGIILDGNDRTLEKKPRL